MLSISEMRGQLLLQDSSAKQSWMFETGISLGGISVEKANAKKKRLNAHEAGQKIAVIIEF